ncbi:MAG: PIN domain-containing protein [Chitinivibrionales bacterium]|nr:PIN domain-containing protein [Chitinivibrionales bacterium]
MPGNARQWAMREGIFREEMSRPKPIYLDVCALQRPYDDKSYYRIRLEAAAVELILTQVKSGMYTMYRSPVHADEIAANMNEVMRLDLQLLLQRSGSSAKPQIKDADALEARGWQLAAAGFGIADAFHAAYAEALGADLISCDDDLLKKCRRCTIKVWYGTPLDFCQKERLI